MNLAFERVSLEIQTGPVAQLENMTALMFYNLSQGGDVKTRDAC